MERQELVQLQLSKQDCIDIVTLIQSASIKGADAKRVSYLIDLIVSAVNHE
jgi:hypothetical protein